VNRAGPVLFVVLLVATIVTAAIVVHARTPDLELEVVHLTHKIASRGEGAHRVAHIRFFVRESDPNATVEVVGPNLTVVRTLYRGPLEANKEVALTWNGRNASGAVPHPHHRYRLRVILPSGNREMILRRRKDLDQAPCA